MGMWKGAACAVLAMLAGWPAVPAAGAQVANPMHTTHVRAFPGCCPRPPWWDAAGPVPHVRSYDEFLAVWQDRTLSDAQRAKALFQAIEDHLHSDDHITAAAVTYFYSVGRSYRHLRALTEFGAARYLDYDQPVARTRGKPGDLAAGMARNLARIYIRDGEPERAVALLRYILGPRRDDVNDHLLELAALYLGQALGTMGRDVEAIKVLTAARRDFAGDWEPRLDEELAMIRGRMGLAYYLHDRRISGPVLIGLLGLVLFLGVTRRRAPRLR